MRNFLRDSKSIYGAVLGTALAASATVHADEPVLQSEGQSSTVGQVAGQPVSFVKHLETAACGAATGGCGPVAGCNGGLDDWSTSLLGDRPLLADLRNVPVNDCLSVSVGGEIRHRFMNEDDRLRPGGPGRSTYDLWRITPWLEMKYGESMSAEPWPLNLKVRSRSATTKRSWGPPTKTLRPE